MGSPAYATAIGLAEYGLGGAERPAELVRTSFEVPAGSFFRRILAIGRALMPQ
ncbi:hypothetical protein D3C83_330320 [compost metagenome]